MYQVSFHVGGINRGISGNCSIGWYKKTSKDKRELVWLLHRETVLCQFCYKKQRLRNRSLTITYGKKPDQCMFNVQDWDCTAVRTHKETFVFARLLRNYWWLLREDCWVCHQRHKPKCHLTHQCHWWVCGSGRCCSTAWLTVALQHASTACQPRKKHFMNFIGIDWLLHWAHRSNSRPLCCLHSPSQPSPAFVYLHTDHWTTSYKITYLPSK